MTAGAGDGLPGFSDQDLPLAVGALTGVRLWRIDLPSFDAVSSGTPIPVTGLLTGAFGVVWPPGENVAVCGGGQRPPADHQAPVPAYRCGCGFWAYWTGRDAQRNDYRLAQVIGIMQGYGRTRIGTRGCRCSKARVVALYVPRVNAELRAWGLHPQEAAETLACYYRVPWYGSLEEMLAHHPPTADYLPRRGQQQRVAGQHSPSRRGADRWRWLPRWARP